MPDVEIAALERAAAGRLSWRAYLPELVPRTTIAQGAIAVYSAFVRNWFAIPDDPLLCGVSFGVADMARPVNNLRTRRSKRVS